MKLTPLDIHHKEFRNALRGYSPEEVDDFLDEVADEFERLFKETIDLSDKLDIAAGRVKEYGALEQTLQNTLVAAQTSADDIRSRAAAEADRLVREAEAKAAEIVGTALNDKQHSQAETARLQAAEESFRASFRSLLEKYMADLGAVGAPAPVAPVVAPEPVVQPMFVDPEPEVEEVVAEDEADDEPEVPTVVQSLTLGESVGSEPELADDDMPSLEIPEEFALPPRGPVGDLDDLDIEEID